MFVCRKVKGLIAASIYEDISPEDRAYLAAHLTACARCRVESEALSRVAHALPVTHPAPYTGDLLPAIRQRLAEAPGRRAWIGWRMALPAVTCLMLAAFLGVMAWTPNPASPPDTAIMAASPLEAAMAAAREEGGQSFGKAMLALREAIQTHPDDSHAGEAQLFLADLEFNHGQRYAEAFAAYDTLRSHYPQTWNSSPTLVKDRYDLLAEARQENFESLYLFDAARNSGAESFAQLEKVVAKYPCKLVASLAMESMRERLCGPEDALPLESRIESMEVVRDRCSDPVAVAQINVALGDMYWHDLRDPVRAREVYSQAAGSGHMTLASLARAALWEMDGIAAGPLP